MRKHFKAGRARVPELLVFHHIPKTAGSALRRTLESNYPPEACVNVYGPGRASVERFQRYVEQLDDRRLGQLRCVAGHGAHLIIPVLAKARIPFRALSLLRDPVERVISLYWYLRPGPKGTRRGRGGRVGREIAARGWSLEDIYRNLRGGRERDSPLHELFSRFFNGQVRMLLMPHEPVPSLPFEQGADADESGSLARLRRLLDDHYVLGVKERFRESVELFADRFGWANTAFRVENVTKTKPNPNEVPPELRSLIRSYNVLDTQLHREYLRRLEGKGVTP